MLSRRMSGWAWAGVIAGISSIGLAGCGTNRTVAMAGRIRITENQLNRALKASQVIQSVTLDQSRSAKQSGAATLAEQALVIQWALAHNVISPGQAQNQAGIWIKQHLMPAVGGPAVFNQRLSRDNLPLSSFRQYVAQQFILKAAFNRVTATVPHPSVADEERYYTNNQAFYISPPEVLLRGITVQSNAEAESIITQLKKGASFGALALRDSRDAYKNQGGSRGWVQFGASSALPKDWLNAIARLRPNRMSIVKGPLGYSIIEVQASRRGATIPFHAVRPAIEAELVEKAQMTMFDGWAANLKKTEKIRLMNT